MHRALLVLSLSPSLPVPRSLSPSPYVCPSPPLHQVKTIMMPRGSVTKEQRELGLVSLRHLKVIESWAWDADDAVSVILFPARLRYAYTTHTHTYTHTHLVFSTARLRCVHARVYAESFESRTHKSIESTKDTAPESSPRIGVLTNAKPAVSLPSRPPARPPSLPPSLPPSPSPPPSFPRSGRPVRSRRCAKCGRRRVMRTSRGACIGFGSCGLRRSSLASLKPFPRPSSRSRLGCKV